MTLITAVVAIRISCYAGGQNFSSLAENMDSYVDMSDYSWRVALIRRLQGINAIFIWVKVNFSLAKKFPKSC